MASKKHRKKLKRIHLTVNAWKSLETTEKAFLQAMDSLTVEAENAAKSFLTFSNLLND